MGGGRHVGQEGSVNISEQLFGQLISAASGKEVPQLSYITYIAKQLFAQEKVVRFVGLSSIPFREICQKEKKKDFRTSGL